MAKLNFKDLIFKFLQKDEDHDCEKVHPKMSHKEWMNTEPVSMYKSESYKSDYEREQPIKVKKAIEIAKRMAGNYTGATKEIEKIAKGLSQLPVVKSVLMRVNEAQDFVKEYLGKSTTRSDPGNMLWYEVEITKGGQYKKISQEELPKWKSKGWKVAFDPSKGKFPKGYFTKDEDFQVKFAQGPGQKISIAHYKDKQDADKFAKDILTKGGKAIITKVKDRLLSNANEDAPANATGTAVAGTGDDSSTVVVRKKKKKELQSKLMRRLKIKETIDRAIPDLEYPKDPIRERTEQLKGFAKEYAMGLQVPATSFMKPVGSLNPLRKKEDVIPQGELKPLKKKNEISNRLKSKVLQRKIDRAKTKMLSKKRLQQP